MPLPSRQMMFLAIALGSLSISAAIAQDRGIADFPKLSAETDWPWWRGPWRNGHGSPRQLPVRFSETENIRWKSPVPGRGHSSPIVVGNQIFLTTADESKQVQSVLAFEKATGKQLWQTAINQGGFPENNHKKNTEASPTIASNGEQLFITFFHHKQIQLTALNLRGEILWQKTVLPFNPQKFEYGYAPSPMLYRNTVIVVGEHDGESAIVALDCKTGDPVWRTPRPNSITFSSPVVAHVAGRDQLLISGAEQVCAYDPSNGNPLWQTAGTTAATCGTMVWDGDIVFASGGYPKAETLAIKADGSGTVLWKNNQKCYEQSMIVVDGYVYALTDRGVLFCWQGSDGKEMWQTRLRGPVSASPILLGGLIYWANEAGTMYVFKPNPAQFELISENQLGDDSFASPAVSGDYLFLRVADSVQNQRQEFLYCIENKAE